ncbi:MAG: helix-turn-helix transcriptional regulator [Thermoguttaceae bacterium]
MSKSNKTTKSQPKAPGPTRTTEAETLAMQLREMIANSGMTVNGLAVAVGIPQPVLQRFVSGERDDLHLSTADKLCAHFGVRLTSRKAGKQPTKGK